MEFFKKVTHPKCKNLSVDIYKTTHKKQISYFFDEHGDGYDATWCKNPLEECIKDALEELDEKYKGSYYSFNSNEYNTDLFLP